MRIYEVRNEADRFWKNVTPTGFCWEWTGTLTTSGYGQFARAPHEQGKQAHRVQSHRWAYEHLVGPIPAGLVLDHLCRNRACVNPDHVEPVTQRENLLRGQHSKHVVRRTGVCRKGHEMIGSNVYEWTSTKTGYTMRRCMTCRRQREGW